MFTAIGITIAIIIASLLVILLCVAVDRSAFKSGYAYAYLEIEAAQADRIWEEELRRELATREVASTN